MLQTVTERAMNNSIVASHSTRAIPPLSPTACLMIKDDVIVLPEWLAYHYTFLPLRRLIVAVDPLSEIDPEPLFNLYRDLGMNITIWHDLFYAKVGKWSFMRPNYMQVEQNMTTTKRSKFINYQQMSFYTACTVHNAMRVHPASVHGRRSLKLASASITTLEPLIPLCNQELLFVEQRFIARGTSSMPRIG